MTTAGDGETPSTTPARQELVGYRTNEEWQELIAQTGAMITALDEIADDATRKAVFDALAGVDAIHREALHRLVRLFKEGVLEQVVTDPAIETLMGMYDLLPEAGPACTRIWDFIGNDKMQTSADDPVALASTDVPPHWSPAPITAAPEDGVALVCHMEEGAHILARADGQLYAFAAQCVTHDTPMYEGHLDKLTWICSHGPGCVYDVRSGARLGGGPGLDCRPVKTDDTGRVLIGFGVPFEPRLPSF